MKVTFLGTAAAEGMPALWCECDTCRQAKAIGGKELRRRCAYAIDNDTMVDFGPDSFWQSVEFNIDLTKLERIIVTHNHGDHLSPMEFLWRRTPWFSQLKRELTVIGTKRIFGKIIAFTAEDCGIYDLADLQIRPVEIGNGESIVEGDMKITAFAANHAPGKEPQIFAIESGGKRFLVANDTGILPDSSWEQLRGIEFDLVEIDCTGGVGCKNWRDGHLTADTMLEFRDKLVGLGCITSKTQVYANHFSHNGKSLHSDLEAFFAPHGIKVAYDGLVVEL